ncbi:MAG: kelch repeat-containing protein [Nitrospirales bacterium]
MTPAAFANRRSRLCALFFGFSLLTTSPVIGQSSSNVSGEGTWHTMAPAPTKRTEVAAAVLGGNVYVVGGFAEPSLSNMASLTVSDAVEAYNPSSNAWTTRASLPSGVHHTGAAAIGNRLYVVGGFTASLFSFWRPVSTVYSYDASTDTWTEVAPLPTRRGALAVTVLDGQLYAVGGYGEGGNSGAVEVYDPAADRWSTKASLPTPRDHLAVVAQGGRIYAVGGRLNIDYGRNLDVTEAYDPATDRWTTVAPLPTPRSGIAAAVIKESIYVLGGEAREGTFRNNEAYRPRTDGWRTVAPMPTARHGLAAVEMDGYLYVIAGGPTPGASYSNVIERYEPGPAQASRPARRGTSARHVGTVMALLAAFEDAGVLPPESSPDATALIRALIQFQAAFMKSGDPVIQHLLRDALAQKLGDDPSAAVQRFRADGWNSESLEAVVEFNEARPVWDQPGLAEGFQAYHVGSREFRVLSRTFIQARTRLSSSGQDFHHIYAKRRREMPGGGM